MANIKTMEYNASITIRTPQDLKQQFQEALSHNDENLSVFFRSVMREYLKQNQLSKNNSIR